jgi:hypothetical protein
LGTTKTISKRPFFTAAEPTKSALGRSLYVKGAFISSPLLPGLLRVVTVSNLSKTLMVTYPLKPLISSP